MHENVVRLAAAGIVISLMFASGAVCAATNVASAYYLPVERSEGRSFRYWAEHPLDQVDTNAEHAVVVVHGVGGGLQDSAWRIRQLLAARRGTWQGGGDSPVAEEFSSYDALDLVFGKRE